MIIDERFATSSARVINAEERKTLTGKEIEDLVNKNIYPAGKQDIKNENDDQSSALGSIGLKPKIVH